jgi:hypothetical protein
MEILESPEDVFNKTIDYLINVENKSIEMCITYLNNWKKSKRFHKEMIKEYNMIKKGEQIPFKISQVHRIFKINQMNSFKKIKKNDSKNNKIDKINTNLKLINQLRDYEQFYRCNEYFDENRYTEYSDFIENETKYISYLMKNQKLL